MSGNDETKNVKNAAKRAAVLEEGGRKKSSAALLVVLAGVLLAAGGAWFAFSGKAGPETAQAAVSVSAQGGEGVSIALSDLGDEKAKFYSYDDGKGTPVRYFAVLGKDGKVHTAFDACDACWPEGKGYKQNGDKMVCQNCRMVFDITRIGDVHGGCNPSPVKSETRGGKVFIAYNDLAAGKRFFDFSKERK